MGPCNSKTQKDDKAQVENLYPPTNSPPRTATGSAANGANVGGFSIGVSDFVREKRGKITEEYNLLSPPLGSGAFGEVRKAVHKTMGWHRAVKIILKSSTTQEEQERLVNEVQILTGLDHPNIIKIYEFFQDDKNFYIVSELCTGGELFDKIIEKKFFSERMAADVLRQTLAAVHYCHSKKIVHRDLKPENILYESPKDTAAVKVIDFGTSKTFDPSQKMNQKFGTPYYIAPEVIRRRYDEKCDVWSIGVIAYILLCGFPPFNGPNDKAIMDKVTKGQYSFEGSEWANVSEAAKNFIRRTMEYDVTRRLSAYEALNDEWILKASSNPELDRPLVVNAFNNLKTFRADRKLAAATWVFLVSVMATREEKEDLLKIFKALDANNDGLLSKDELLAGYKNYFKNAFAEEDIDTIMRTIDSNNNGGIDYSEFVSATINRQSLLSRQRLEAVFKMFDKDGNGYITKEELMEFFSKSNIPADQWALIIREIDENGDGQISFKEFKEMMLRML